MYSDTNYSDAPFGVELESFALEGDLLLSDGAFSTTASNMHDPLLETPSAMGTGSRRTLAGAMTSHANLVNYAAAFGGGGNVVNNNAVAVGLDDEGNDDDDEDDPVQRLMRSPVHQPQPQTIKKLKTQLSGIGGDGGYLTSPMGMLRRPQEQHSAVPDYGGQQYSSGIGASTSSAAFMQNNNNLVSFSNNTTTDTGNIFAPYNNQSYQQQSQSQVQSSSNNLSTINNRGHTMQRMRSAPPETLGPLSPQQHNHQYAVNMRRAQTAINPGLGLPNGTFHQLDYGAYGQGDDEGDEEDDDDDLGQPVASSSSAYPYVNSGGQQQQQYQNQQSLRSAQISAYAASIQQHRQNQQHQHSSEQMQLQMPRSPSQPHHHQQQPQQNLDRPFIQYVPPNSPAGKAATRNKRGLSVKTGENSKASQKLVPIKMTSPVRLPTSPPMSHLMHQQQRALTQTSPTKTSQHASYIVAPRSAPLPTAPSFNFSLQQYTTDGEQFQQHQQDYTGYPGLLGPSSSQYDVCSPPGSSGLLSPTHASATSGHSTAFTTEDEAVFGIPGSPFIDPVSSMGTSIDQALASLLETHQVANALTSHPPSSPGPQQHGMLGFGSPPLSPQPSMQHDGMSAYQWSQQQQQSQGQQQNVLLSPPQQHGSSIRPLRQQQQQVMAPNMLDPALAQYTSHQNGMLSPISSNVLQTSAASNGRVISSPRRLRGMQSAPDLGRLMASDSGQGRPSSPRKASLKRQRNYTESEDEDEENEFGIPNESGTSDDLSDDLEYQLAEDNGYDGPPAKKRSTSSSYRSPAASPYGSQQSQTPFAGINPNPSRLRPGPKPKTSLPNLQAARQTVFTVATNAPPVPPLPSNFKMAAVAGAFSQNQQQPPNFYANDIGSPVMSPSVMSPTTEAQFANLQGQPGCSKDILAQFYTVGTGSRQTKKGKAQRMYLCAIPGCQKEFPRKSAVESHIQTHLEDKPFLCTYDGCGASFVRSHDLTRHVRIHSGSKPFTCQCGKGFARGDALTRHRQRGICEGSTVPRRW